VASVSARRRRKKDYARGVPEAVHGPIKPGYNFYVRNAGITDIQNLLIFGRCWVRQINSE